jgi:hypothetical protein
MNKELLKLATYYCTDRNKLNENLNVYPKECVDIIKDLLDLNFSDPNFSSLAEAVPINIAGYLPHEKKHGYDGFKGETYETGYEWVENKPKKSISLDGVISNKLNGSGGFADYTLRRLNDDKSLGDKLYLLVSGFADGNLLYVYKVPHNYPEFMNHIENRTLKLINEGVRVLPSFSYKNYEYCQDIELTWIRDDIENYYEYMSGPFYNWLISLKRKRDR